MNVTRAELNEICNALNSHAHELQRDAKKSRAKGHTYSQIEVVEHSAKTLLALSLRLIEERNADDAFELEDALDASLNDHAFYVGPGRSAGDY